MSDDDEPCAECSGERTVSVDCFTPSRGHFTIEEPCEACTGDEYADLELDADLSPFERSLSVLPLMQSRVSDR
jgi:hypothetical protein